MKRRILIIILFIVIIFTSIFAIFSLSKKDEKVVKDVSTTNETTSEELSTTTLTTTTEVLTTSKTTTNNQQTTTKETTTKKTTTKKTTTTLDYKIVTENVSEDTTKYGTVISNIYEVKYKVYNDGRKIETSKKKKRVSVNSTNYKADTSELKSEAQSVVNSNLSDYKEMLSYVNSYRSEVGASPLSLDNNLNLAATIRALEMAYSRKFSHTRPDARDCFTVAKDLSISYNAIGENIALGQRSVKSVSESWKESSGHYANMISTDFKKVGFGKFNIDSSIYWVQIFTN